MFSQHSSSGSSLTASRANGPTSSFNNIRSRTPPTSHQHRRGSTTSSISQQSSFSKNILTTQRRGSAATTRSIQDHQQQQHVVLLDSPSSRKSGTNNDDTRSLAGRSVTSAAHSTYSAGGGGRRNSSVSLSPGSRSSARQNSNKAPRLYLPGEEELVISKNVIDTSTAVNDLELLENDLGRASLMMPKDVREKMLAMRSQLFANSKNHEDADGGSGVTGITEKLLGLAQQKTGVVEKDGDEQKQQEEEKNPLPRGSHLLKRLQASVDRSSALMEELSTTTNSCNNMIDQLIFAATREERHAAKLEQKKKQAALAERLSGVTPVSPSPSSKQQVVLTPSPQLQKPIGKRNDDYLGDTLAALDYSPNSPPSHQTSQQRGRGNLDDTFAAI